MTEANKHLLSLFQIHERDNVAVAVMPLKAGQHVEVAGKAVIVLQDVSLGAKVALRSLVRHDKIVKFGEVIGSATAAIQPGEYIHTHNLKSDYLPTPLG